MSHQNNLPTGVKLENTSFGQNAKTNTYTKPQFISQSISFVVINVNSFFLANPSNVQKGRPRGGLTLFIS